MCNISCRISQKSARNKDSLYSTKLNAVLLHNNISGAAFDFKRRNINISQENFAH